MSMREGRGGRGGRGRPRRDYHYPSRSEDRSYHGRERESNPPSRHLWVGNLPHSLTEGDVARHFLHFGELESLAFQPGRSYAFVNYRNEEDAYAAKKELQDFVIEGNLLRIEFAKAEKSLVQPRDADYSERRDNSHSRGRGSPFYMRDSRMRYSSPELSHPSKSKMSDKNAEPSEVLWIGFPAQLKVDEFALRKAFSSFGDIEKITAFPGRTYAFVRFRDLMAACRAKETMQGKLFGNSRVHICFAKNDVGPSNRERNSIHAPLSPHTGKYGRAEHFDDFRSDRDFDHISGDSSFRSPSYESNLDRGDRNMRNTDLWPGEMDIHEQRRFPGQRSELGFHEDYYDDPRSPPRNIEAHIRNFSPKGYPRRGPIYDDPWDLPEDVSLLHGTKKLKTDMFPTDNELPEYPLSDLRKSKRIPSHDIPQSGLRDNDENSRHSGYRPIPERAMSTSQPFMERGDHWNAPYDDFQVAPSPMPMPPLDRRKLTPHSRESSSKEVWRWEGMIAKGGTSVCRARCFPVGKPPEIVLPEILDCTARTSLDMLAKHYYQAVSAWVVFFAPANDPDISYYNEFLSYLGEKQRAAVVKLDERNTLFLVPPSEFSEKVLKVPGKLSISGVVLWIDPPGSSYGSHPQNENRENSFASFQNDSASAYQKPPSGPYLPPPPLFPGNSSSISDMRSIDPQRHDYVRNPAPGANWSPHDYQNSNPATGSAGHPYYAVSRPMQEASHSNYTPSNSGLPTSGNGNGKWPVQENPPVPSSISVADPPAEQLAQLTSSLLGQQGQMGGTSSSGEYKPSGVNINQPGYQYRMPQNYGVPNDQISSDIPPSLYGQVQQFLQRAPNLVASQRDAQYNPQLPISEQDEPDADPQKRLEATLHLAAALLQQIQQGKGT